MSNEEVNESDSIEQIIKKTSKHDEGGVADLEKVTDYVEEADIGGANIGNAMMMVNAREQKELCAKELKEEELRRVRIDKADVDTIVNELEIDRCLAERSLRQHKGDLLSTLSTLTN